MSSSLPECTIRAKDSFRDPLQLNFNVEMGPELLADQLYYRRIILNVLWTSPQVLCSLPQQMLTDFYFCDFYVVFSLRCAKISLKT